MFGRVMKKFLQRLSPKRRIAALVDAVVDRLNDKYALAGAVKLTDGGMTFEARIVDIKPGDKITLPDDDGED